MPAFNPLTDSSVLLARLGRHSGLVVVCYCAAWCNTCAQYQKDFNKLAEKWPEHTFVWVDIEESPELLGDEDIETFPTISMQSTSANVFFGTLQPYIDHLDRLISHAGNPAQAIKGGPPLLRRLLTPAAQ
jgi:thiol-disulfide isomerase/thioredoxin